MKGATVAVIVGAVVVAGGGVAYAVVRKKKDTSVTAQRAVVGSKAVAAGAPALPPGLQQNAWQKITGKVSAFVPPGAAASPAYQQQASGGGGVGLYNKAAAVTDLLYPGVGSKAKKVLNTLDNLIGGKASSMAKKIPLIGGLF